MVNLDKAWRMVCGDCGEPVIVDLLEDGTLGSTHVCPKVQTDPDDERDARTTEDFADPYGRFGPVPEL